MKHLVVGRVVIFFLLIFVVLFHQNKGAMPSPNIMAQRNWKEVNLEYFSFCLPPEMTPLKAKGVDSAIWKYTGDNMELTIDLGMYSEKPSNVKEEPEYREERIKIDGKRATIVFFRDSYADRDSRPYVAAVYFPRVGVNKMSLSFFVTCASPQEQEIAKKIFLSINFK